MDVIAGFKSSQNAMILYLVSRGGRREGSGGAGAGGRLPSPRGCGGGGQGAWRGRGPCTGREWIKIPSRRFSRYPSTGSIPKVNISIAHLSPWRTDNLVFLMHQTTYIVYTPLNYGQEYLLSFKTFLSIQFDILNERK